MFCISVFNLEGNLAIYLTFIPFLTLHPEQFVCLIKKKTCIRDFFNLHDCTFKFVVPNILP